MVLATFWPQQGPRTLQKPRGQMPENDHARQCQALVSMNWGSAVLAEPFNIASRLPSSGSDLVWQSSSSNATMDDETQAILANVLGQPAWFADVALDKIVDPCAEPKQW